MEMDGRISPLGTSTREWEFVKDLEIEMSYAYQKVSKDANHDDVKSYLEKHGVIVVDMATVGGGVLDLHCYYRDIVSWIEVKVSGTSEIKRSQLKFMANWPGVCGVARNGEEAFKIARGNGLTVDQKIGLTMYLRSMKASRVGLGVVEKVIG
jgi:hypothetical protein